jgi:hypothetical protein
MTSNPFAPRQSEPSSFDASHVFESPKLDKLHQTKPQSGLVEYTIYCSGAPHLAQFSRLTGIPVFKLGVARFGASNRIRGLCRHLYAGLWGRPGDEPPAMTVLAGADAWVPIRLRCPVGFDAKASRAVRFDDGGLSIKLPAELHPETVDRMVGDLLQKIELRRALLTDAGQHRLRNGGVDPKGWFYTHYRNGDRPDQLAEARELYVFEPREHTLHLTQGLAGLVRHHGGALDHE